MSPLHVLRVKRIRELKQAKQCVFTDRVRPHSFYFFEASGSMRVQLLRAPTLTLFPPGTDDPLCADESFAYAARERILRIQASEPMHMRAPTFILFPFVYVAVAVYVTCRALLQL